MTAGEFDRLTALVTGGASGIGLAAAQHLAARGARVAILDRDTLRPDATAAGSNGNAGGAGRDAGGAGRDAGGAANGEGGGSAGEAANGEGGGRAGALDSFVADVTDDAAVRAAVSAAAEALGGIDILVNNAGIGAIGTVEDNDDEEWRRIFEVNVFGMVRTSRAALPHLRRAARQRGTAVIVNTCSVAASAGLPQRALYSATKGAVYSLTLAMAADYVTDGIRVACVNPGTADTPWVSRLLDASPDPAAERAALAARQPMGRLVSAAEVAAAIAYLASPLSGATTGVALAVDGGMSGLRLRPPGQALR
jgi:2-keto-3-deoxy-L-fuconate dehydrogenase